MSKIRQSAKNQACKFRLEGICSFLPDKTVWCHAPSSRKGTSLKSPDRWGSDGCSDCHSVMDNMAHKYWDTHNYWEAWFRAVDAGQNRLEGDGLLIEVTSEPRQVKLRKVFPRTVKGLMP